MLPQESIRHFSRDLDPLLSTSLTKTPRLSASISTTATTILQAQSPDIHAFTECYVLGMKILNKAFKNCVLDAIAEAINNESFYSPGLTSTGLTRILNDGKTDGSPARRLLADIWAYSDGPEKTLRRFMDGMPRAFSMDLNAALYKLNGGFVGRGAPWVGGMQKYYKRRHYMGEITGAEAEVIVLRGNRRSSSIAGERKTGVSCYFPLSLQLCPKHPSSLAIVSHWMNQTREPFGRRYKLPRS